MFLRGPLLRTSWNLSIINKAVAYMAGSSAESVRAGAHSGALLNLARRFVWLISWEGDMSSKSRLWSSLFEGSLLTLF